MWIPFILVVVCRGSKGFGVIFGQFLRIFKLELAWLGGLVLLKIPCIARGALPDTLLAHMWRNVQYEGAK